MSSTLTFNTGAAVAQMIEWLSSEFMDNVPDEKVVPYQVFIVVSV